MTTYNDATPYSLDMLWRKGDKFTFLDQGITLYKNKECGDILDLTPYDGLLEIRVRPQDDPIETITTSSGEMIFTSNVITFSKTDLSLKVDKYYYTLLLVDKIDTSIVGTLFKGRFEVIS